MPGYFVRTRRRLRSRSLLGEPQHRLRLSTKAPALENEKAGRELAARAARVQDGNARPHLYGLDGDETADILVLVRNHFADRLGNRDLRRRGRRDARQASARPE